MSDISKNILEQIKEEGIKPRPRWQFILISLILIVVLTATVVIGGVAMSLIFLKLFNLEWDLVTVMGEGGRPAILGVLPLIWIVLLVLVLGLAVGVFEKTETGYKYHPILVVMGAILISVLLGAVLYGARGADLFDRVLQENIGAYNELEKRQALQFHLPEVGVLPGRVLEIVSPSIMQLEDLREHVWTVNLPPDLLEKKKFNHIPLNSMVVVRGEKLDDDSFEADDFHLKNDLPMRLKRKFKKSVRELED